MNLIEKFALTTYGTDSLYPDTGCYLKQMIGKTYNSIDEMGSDINHEVRRIEAQIKKIQQNEVRNGGIVLPSERLVSLKLVNVQQLPDAETLGVQVTYEVTNREGESEEGTLF